MSSDRFDRVCLCGNDECERARKVTLGVVGPDHPWGLGSEGLMQIREKSDCPIQSALRECVAVHFRFTEVIKKQKCYWVSMSHWPAFVQTLTSRGWEKQNKVFRSSRAAQAADVQYFNGEVQFANDKYRIGTLLETIDTPDKDRYGQQYVKAPLNPIGKVWETLRQLQDDKAQQLAAEQTSLALATPATYPVAAVSNVTLLTRSTSVPRPTQPLVVLPTSSIFSLQRFSSHVNLSPQRAKRTHESVGTPTRENVPEQAEWPSPSSISFDDPMVETVEIDFDNDEIVIPDCPIFSDDVSYDMDPEENSQDAKDSSTDWTNCRSLDFDDEVSHLQDGASQASQDDMSQGVASQDDMSQGVASQGKAFQNLPDALLDAPMDHGGTLDEMGETTGSTQQENADTGSLNLTQDMLETALLNDSLDAPNGSESLNLSAILPNTSESVNMSLEEPDTNTESLNMSIEARGTFESLDTSLDAIELPVPTFSSPADAVTYAYSKQGCLDTMRRVSKDVKYDPIKMRESFDFRSTVCHVISAFDQWESEFLGGGKTIVFCRAGGDKCENFRLLKQRAGPTTVFKCSKCMGGHTNKQRRASTARKAQKLGHDHSKASSSCPYDKNTPRTLANRTRNITGKLKVTKTKVKRLLNLLQQKEEMIVDMKSSKNLVKVLQMALTHCNKPEQQAKLRGEVIETLISSHKAYSVNRTTKRTDDELQAELSDYAKQITSTLENYAKRLAGKPKQCRFNASVIRTALAMWLKSPSNYDAMRRHSIEVLPSARTLQNVQKKLVPNEGSCPKLYGWFRDARKELSDFDFRGTILFDEMTLKTDLYSNVKNNTTYGFAASDCEFADQFDLSAELNDLYREATTEPTENEPSQPGAAPTTGQAKGKKKTKSAKKRKGKEDSDFSYQPAKKVNLFRFRDQAGEAANVEYWFNSGSLTGSTTLLQLLHVIHHCELIDVPIYMICADSGGSNSSLYKALREKSAKDVLGDIDWLDERVCSFRNPCDPSRRIYITPCSVHLLKAMRNNLLKSQKHKKAVRNFWRNGVNFGWDQVLELFLLDKGANGASKQRTDLRKASIDPDHANKMGVVEAKAPFTYRTLIVFCDQVAEVLDNYDPIAMARDVARVSQERGFETKGYQAEKLDLMLELLKGKVELAGNVDDNLRARMECLEYSIAVHGIFIARFLNYKAVIVKKRRKYANGSIQPRIRVKGEFQILELKTEEERMKKYLAFFNSWYVDAKATQKKGERKNQWEKGFLSEITFRNLQQCVWGFLAYCRAVLDLPTTKTGWYVPYRIANQSTVENVFSRLRGDKRDTPQTIAKGLLALDVSQDVSTYNLKRNKMYPTDMVAKVDIHTGGLIDSRRDESRKDKLDQWLLERMMAKAGRNQMPPPAAAALETPDTRVVGRGHGRRHGAPNDSAQAFQYWQEHLFPRGSTRFSDLLLQDDDFKETIKVSIYQRREEFFHTLTTLKSEQEEVALDEFCHQVVGIQLASVLKKSQSNGKTMIDFLLSEEFTRLMYAMPNPGLHDRCGLGLIALKINQILLTRVRKALVSATEEKRAYMDSFVWGADESTRESETKLLVNRFVGYGLFRLINMTTNKAKGESDDDSRDGSTDDSTEEEDSEVTLQRKLAFFRSMRIFHAEALWLDDYVEHYYDHVLALENNGFLALVSPAYMEFGYKLMATIRECISPQRIRRDGEHVLKNAKADLEIQKPALYDCLEACFAKHQQGLEVDQETKQRALDYIAEKAFHAYFGCCQKEVRENLVEKGGAHYVPSNLRTFLRDISVKSSSLPPEVRAAMEWED